MRGEVVSERPAHPDGHKYEFNCCPNPDVRRFPEVTDDHGRAIIRCETCGHDWTGQMSGEPTECDAEGCHAEVEQEAGLPHRRLCDSCAEAQALGSVEAPENGWPKYSDMDTI